MFFRTPRFIRRWIRARMNPMGVDKAWTMRQKLSVAYMIIAWHAFGFVAYQMSKGNVHWPVTKGLITAEEQSMNRPAYQWAKTFGIQKAEVYRIGKSGIGEKEFIDLSNEESTAKTVQSESELDQE